MTSHYLNQWWLDYWPIYVSLGLNELTYWWYTHVHYADLSLMQAVPCCLFPWWRHQMETFSTLLALCAGNSQVTGEFPAQRPVTWSFDIFFDLCPNKRLSKQLWGWWVETPSHSLWRQCNSCEAGELRHHRIHYDVNVTVVRLVSWDTIAFIMTSM